MLCPSLLCLLLLGANPAREPESLLLIQQRQPRLLEDRAESVDDQKYARFKRTQALLVKSYFVLNSALRNPEISGLPSVKAHGDDPVAWLQQNLVVELPNDSEIMRLKLKDGLPDERAKIINAVANAYIEEVVVRARREALERQEMLKSTYDEYMAKYADLLKSEHALSKKLGTDRSDLHSQIATASLKEQYAKMKDRLGEIEVQLAVLEHRADEADTAIKDTASKDTATKDPTAKETDKDTPNESSTKAAPTPGDTRQAIVDLTVEQKIYELRLEELNQRLSQLDLFSSDFERAEFELAEMRRILPRLNQQLMTDATNLKAPDRVVIVQEAVPSAH